MEIQRQSLMPSCQLDQSQEGKIEEQSEHESDQEPSQGGGSDHGPGNA